MDVQRARPLQTGQLLITVKHAMMVITLTVPDALRLLVQMVPSQGLTVRATQVTSVAAHGRAGLHTLRAQKNIHA